jgi:hypothetical protein
MKNLIGEEDSSGAERLWLRLAEISSVAKIKYVVLPAGELAVWRPRRLPCEK